MQSWLTKAFFANGTIEGFHSWREESLTQFFVIKQDKLTSVIRVSDDWKWRLKLHAVWVDNIEDCLIEKLGFFRRKLKLGTVLCKLRF